MKLMTLEEFRIKVVKDRLYHLKWNRRAAAKSLGRSYDWIIKTINKYKIGE